MKIESVELVIFDWNGTLLDDLEFVFESVLEIFRRYEVPPPTLEEYRREITADFMQFYWNHGIPRSATGDDLNKIRIEVLRAIDLDRYLLVDGVLEVLKGLANRSVKLAIASSGNTEVIAAQLTHLEISDLFDPVITDAWDKVAALKQALKHFGLEPHEAVYIDDTYDGLIAAKNAGLLACGVTWGYNSRERILAAEPDYVIDELKELIELLTSSNQ